MRALLLAVAFVAGCEAASPCGDDIEAFVDVTDGGSDAADAADAATDADTGHSDAAAVTDGSLLPDASELPVLDMTGVPLDLTRTYDFAGVDADTMICASFAAWCSVCVPTCCATGVYKPNIPCLDCAEQKCSAP